ncbi:MAG TPA: FKBP-type peptidyl-prolyl cis-trans isomerase [Allosphingosinicella sp.]|jgi:FKBP-type peptidyl-prolyl cis-trans isomerase FkpA
MSVTAVPLHPIRKGAVLQLWLGLALLVVLAAALAWAGTSAFQTVKTASGVTLRTIRPGTGPAITDKDVAALHYKLHVKAVDAPVIQDSREMGQPFVTTTQGIYPGFAEGLQHMKQGGSYVLSLPGGTHEQQAPPGAPFTPQDTLVFEIDVLQVERGAAQKFLQLQQMQRMQQIQQMQQMQGQAGAAPGVAGEAPPPPPEGRRGG